MGAIDVRLRVAEEPHVAVASLDADPLPYQEGRAGAASQPKEADAYAIIGDAYLGLGDLAAAEAACKEVAARAPGFYRRRYGAICDLAGHAVSGIPARTTANRRA